MTRCSRMLIGEYTDQLEVEYRVGSSTSMELHTEYGRPDPQRADVAGHMLPLRSWDYAMGWTWDYLRKARSTQLQADIAASIVAVRNRWRIELLTRLLKRGDDSGVAYGLGTSGLSPGFATDYTAARAWTSFPRTMAGLRSPARMSTMLASAAARSRLLCSRTPAPNCASMATWGHTSSSSARLTKRPSAA